MLYKILYVLIVDPQRSVQQQLFYKNQNRWPSHSVSVKGWTSFTLISFKASQYKGKRIYAVPCKIFFRDKKEVGAFVVTSHRSRSIHSLNRSPHVIITERTILI